MWRTAPEDGIAEEEIEPRVREVLRFVELEHTLEQVPSELSGGMRRRVSLREHWSTPAHRAVRFTDCGLDQ